MYIHISKSVAIVISALLVLATQIAYATDLTLADGRVLEQAKLLSPSATDVVIMHKGGIENVPFNLIPDEFLEAQGISKTQKSKKLENKIPYKQKEALPTRRLGIKNVGNVSTEQQAMDAVLLINIFDENETFLGHGTGFYLGPDGFVVTNTHVIVGASYAEIVEKNGDTFRVDSCEYAIPSRDFAILKIERKPKYFFKITDVPEIGDEITALGNPEDDRWVSSTGQISGVHDFGPQLHHTITAELRPGNSGGPIINSKYMVVGQAQYRLPYEYLISDGILVRKVLSYVYRSKCIDFAGDHRWSVWDVSFKELTRFNKEYEALEDYLLLLSYLNEIYEIVLNEARNISYTRDVKYNPAHLGIDGKPIAIYDRLSVNWANGKKIETIADAASTYYKSRYQEYSDLEIKGVFNKSDFAFRSIARGIQQINRADGRDYRRGTQVFSSGRRILSQSKATIRDLLWECHSLIEKYGLPNSMQEATYQKLLRTSELLESKTGKKLFE